MTNAVRMMRTFFTLAALLLLSAACRTPDPTPPPATAVSLANPSPTAAPSPTPTNNDVFIPVGVNDQATATPPPSPTPVPSPTVPSPTPTPAFPVYDGPPLNRDDFGLQIHIHREDLSQIFTHLNAVGVGWVKAQVSWKLYQPAPDRYSDERFAELDNLVNIAQNDGIKVLLSVSKAPEWSRPTTEMDGPPSDYTLYRDFMQVLAERYDGRVAAYELWNEPNLQREWNGVPLSGADLMSLIRLGAEGVRAVDDDVILISAAPATTGINDGVVAIDDRVYLRQMVDAGVGEVVDAIGVHPYGWANPPDSSAADPDTAVPSHNNHPSFFFSDTLNDYLAILNEAGLTQTPLWITEFGWGSFDNLGAPSPAGAEFMANVSEWQQAEYLMRAYQIAHENERIGPLILWNLNFGPLLGQAFSETGYSILRPDGAPRPAYHSLQSIPKR